MNTKGMTNEEVIAGEISKLEYKEKEVSLAKVQFELEQQYVAMHVSYWQLMTMCDSK